MSIKKSSNKRLALALSYLSLTVQILTTFLFTPFVLQILGKNEYGLYQLMASTISYLSLLGFGFSSSYIRFFSRYEIHDEKEKISKLNGLFLSLFLGIAILCIILGALLIFNIRFLFGDGLQENEYSTAKILMIILVLNMALTFPKSIFICNTSAHEKFVFQKGLVLFQTIISPIFQFVLLICGKGSIGLAFSALAVSIIEFIINVIFNIKILKITFSFGWPDFQLLKEITVFTFFIFLNQLLDMLWSANIDNFLIGRICGTEEVTIYSMGNKFNQVFYSVSTPISTLYVPLINRIVANGEDDSKLTDIFVKVGRYQYMVLLLIFSAFCIWGREFIYFWIGSGYEESYVIAILLIGSVIISLSQNIGIEIQRAKNKHQIRSIVYLCIAIGNLFISIPLVKIFGAVGAAVGTAIALILGTVIFMNIYYIRVLNINVKKYWKKCITITTKTIPCILMGIIIKKLVSPSSLIVLGIEIAIFVLLFAGICYAFELTEDERQFIDIQNSWKKKKG